MTGAGRVAGGPIDTSACDETGPSGGSLVPEPAREVVSANVGERVAMMMIKSANEHRSLARERKRDAADAEERAQREEIDTLRKKADAQLTGGLLSAGAKAGAAACTFGTDRAAQAGVKAADAGDSAVNGIYNARATDLDASAKEQSNAASRAKRSLEEASELVRDCQDHAKKALDLYKEFTASHNQMQRAAIHRA
ncbi:MAG: hypothetical protein R3B36_22445 [Polyangiaceae bacterium]